MSNSEKRFLSGLLDRIFSPEKDSQATSTKERVQKSLQARRLSMEPLEDRQLLAVTPADYATIQNSFDSLQLGDYSSVNIIEIENCSLTASSLRDAISQAGTTAQDDVVLVRTTADFSTIDLQGEPLQINIDPDAFGSIAILGYGDAALRLTNADSTVLAVDSGDVALGKISFVTFSGAAQKSSILQQGTNAEVSTQQVLFSGYTADVSESDSSLSPSGVLDNGYYSAEFQLDGSKWVYVVGLSEFEARDIENNIVAGTVNYYVGSFFDAEKSGVDDSMLCWAATSSNILHYTGWDYFLQGNEDDTLDVFRENFADDGSRIEFGNEWFLTGRYAAQGWGNGWAQLEGDGGGYYASAGVNYRDYGGLIDSESYFNNNAESPVAELGRLFENGSGVGLALGWYREAAGEEEGEIIYTRAGGHAISMWGFVYDDEKEVGATDYYTSLIVSDSDDNYGQGRNAPNRLQTYAVTWLDSMGGYQFDAYGRGETFSGIIEDFAYIATRPEDVLVNDLRFQTPTDWSDPVVVTRSEEGRTHQDRFSTGVPLYLSASWFQSDAMDEYSVTLSMDGEVIQTWTVDGAKIGINERFLELGELPAGIHEFVVTLDSENVVENEDKDNNTYSFTIEIIDVCVSTHEDVVDPGDGVLSLREAIEQSNAGALPEGSVVWFSDEVTAQTIVLNSPLTITRPITIDATANWLESGPGIAISGQDLYNVFVVEADATVNDQIVLKGLLIENGSGNYGGAIYHNGNNNDDYALSIVDCTITNSSANFGGAIYNQSGTLFLSSVADAESEAVMQTIVQKNVAVKDGGAIYVVAGDVSTDGVLLQENKAENGGAVYAVGVEYQTNSLEFNNSTLIRNVATNVGGAVRGWNIEATGTRFAENSAVSGAGIASWNNLNLIDSSVVANGTIQDGVYGGKYGGGIFATGNVTLGDQTIVSQNNAYYGGGIYLFQKENQQETSVLNLATSSSIDGNRANSGGGIYVNAGGVVDIDSGNIVDNTADVNGGGIFNYKGTVQILNGQQISGNVATTGNGGGIYNDGDLAIASRGTVSGNAAGNFGGGIFNGSVLTVDQGTVADNEAVDGGGVYNIGTMTIGNSILVDNFAESRGGAVFNQAAIYSVALVDSTIAGNVARTSGGGIYNAGAISVGNSIIAKNILQTHTAKTVSDLYTLNGVNAVSNVNYSLIGDSTNTEKAFVGVGNLVGTRMDPLDPKFIEFDLNESWEYWNLRLQFGSPAINAGPVLSERGYDYDGTTRKSGEPEDIGAFEMYERASLVVTTLDDVVDATDGVTSLREAVEYLRANPYLTGRTISFDQTLAGGTIYLTQGTLWIDVAMTIDASGLINGKTSLSGITVNAMGLNRAFYIAKDTPNVVLNGLTISGGYIDAANQGGGLYSAGGSAIYNRGELDLVNCVVSGNATTYNGGAIFNYGTISIVNSTIAGNYASIGGGLYNRGIATVQNSIIAKNRAIDSSDLWTENLDSVHTVVDYSLLGNASHKTGKDYELVVVDDGGEEDPEVVAAEEEAASTVIAGTSSKPVDPKFITFNYYSLNAWTYDIAQNWNLRVDISSPAYNAGSNDLAIDDQGNPLEFDVVGNARIYADVVDMGAYELTPDVPSLLVTTLADLVNEYDGKISLREAISLAGTEGFGSTVKFAQGLAGQTIVLNGTEIVLDKSVKIDASNLYNFKLDVPGITIDAAEASRIFKIEAGSEESPVVVELISLSLQNGYDPVAGGAILNEGTLIADGLSILDSASLDGGAIMNSGTLSLTFSKIENAAAQYQWTEETNELGETSVVVWGGNGGAVYNAGIMNAFDSEIVRCAASNGGAIFNASGATLTTDSLSVVANEATEYQYNIVLVEGEVVSYDAYGGFGGGVCNAPGVEDDDVFATATLTNSAFLGNVAGEGGGFYNEGIATFVNSTIAGNSAEFGAGIENYANSVVLDNSIVANNFSRDQADIWTTDDSQTTTVARYSLVGDTRTLNETENKVVDFEQSEASLFDVDPKFVVSPEFDENGVLLNLDSIDLSIVADSPAFNAGSNALAVDANGETLEADLFGGTRIVVGTVDMGAIERGLVVTTAKDRVDPFDGVLSLREAIELAQDGDKITFDESLYRSVISLSNQELVVDKSIEIDATVLWDWEYNQPGVTIDAHQRSRIFNLEVVGETSYAKISGLTLINGIADYMGGAIRNVGNASVSNSIISSSSAYYGGAVYNTGYLDLEKTTLSGNSATYGGAIYATASANVVSHSNAYIDNSANNGGAVYNKGTFSFAYNELSDNFARFGGALYNQAGTANVIDSTWDGNEATWKGGAIYNNQDAELSIVRGVADYGNSFSQNVSYYGGAIYNAGTANVSDSLFDENVGTLGGVVYSATGASTTANWIVARNNDAVKYGGAIYNNGSSVVLNDVEFSQNQSSRGGAIYNNAGSISIQSGTFASNAANKGAAVYNNATLDVEDAAFSGNSAIYGGAIYNAFIMNVSNSFFGENVATRLGGAVYNTSNRISTISSSEISGNKANDGGGVYNLTGTLRVYSSIFAGNNATRNGGGVYNAATLRIVNSTVAGNSAFYFGGGVYNASFLGVDNSILAFNVTNTGRGSDLFTRTLANSAVNYSLINKGKGGISLGKEFSGANNLLNVDPLFEKFEPYAYADWSNVLYQNWNLYLQLDSPAFNSGSNDLAVDADGNVLKNDVYGLKRIVNNVVDRGAVEYQKIVVSTTEDVVDPEDGVISLREAIETAEDNDVIVFASSLLGETGEATITLTQGELVIDKSIKIDASNMVEFNEDGIGFALSIDAQNSSRVFNISAENVVIDGLALLNGDAGKAYRGGLVYNSGSVYFPVVVFSNGSATYGGALYNEGSVTTGTAIFQGNQSESNGGAVYNKGQFVVATRASVYDNSSNASGGAIYNAATGTIDAKTLYAAQNQAKTSGGALYNQGTVKLTSGNFFGNEATEGGAVYNDADAVLYAVNESIMGNKASRNGGGIYNKGTLVTTNCSIGGNVAQYYGGGVYNAGTLTADNTIFAKNFTKLAKNLDLYTTAAETALSTLNYSLIGKSEQTVAGENNLLDVDPLFADFEDFGYDDWTNELYKNWASGKLNEGSAAIDAGSNELAVDFNGDLLETDYFGDARIVNEIVDMGAAEFQPAEVVDPGDEETPDVE